MTVHGILAFLLLANAVALVCVFNPWTDAWRRQGAVFLLVEIAAAVAIGVPVFLHHYVRKKKPFAQAVSDAASTVIDFVAGWV